MTRFFKWLKLKFHKCETFPDGILWVGNGTQLCSICRRRENE